MDLKLSRYLVVTRPFKDARDGLAKQIVFATRSSEARVLPCIVWHKLQSGKLQELPHEIVLEMVRIHVLVPADENELETVLADNDDEAQDSDSIYYVIQPTANCQLGCGYCGQEHTNKLLDPEDQARTLERIEARLRQRPFKELSIAWFGSEPLMGLPVIRTMVPALVALAEKYGCTYSSKIVTNGLSLTARVAEELIKELRIDHIEVTLDGTAEHHDRRRHTKQGAPTFDLIYRNLVALCRSELDVVITLRCNVDRHNVEGVAPLIDQLVADKLQTRLSFYIAYVHSWGNDADKEALPMTEFAVKQIEWSAYMARVGFKFSLLPERVPVVCMSVMPDAELVDAYGNLFNCTEVSYVPAYGTPNLYSIGTAKRGEEQHKRVKLQMFNDEVRAGKYDCPTCRMLPVCGGGCPKQWIEGRKPCPPTKFNIEERLLVDFALARKAEAEAAAHA